MSGLCAPKCLHQDYCAFFGCPFEREPQSSGVGPGHHHPRSMTRGFASRPQPASGRARDRAIGPADSRFNSQVVA